MFTMARHAGRSGVLAACLLAMLAGPASAAGAEVVTGRDSLDGVDHDFMICGWEATFTARGQIHWTVAIADDHHGHVTVQEAVTYTLVIDDDPSVPPSLRGETWRGQSMISFTANFDPSSEREVTRQVQTFFEGPFRGLSERIALRIAADGTVLVDSFVSKFDVDCAALGA